MKKTLFLSPPSFDGFDGGAGARYQAKREITSYWFPTWLAQPAAMVPGSKLMDARAAPPDDGRRARDRQRLRAVHSPHQHAVAEERRAVRRSHQGEESARADRLHRRACRDSARRDAATGAPAIDFVCRNEFDYTCLDVAQGKPWSEIKGLSWRDADGRIHHNPERELIHDWDAMPSVLPVYHRDLKIEKYFIGYLQHPYVSFYTGRGCPAKCTFCLWPQTIGGHAYRTKSPAAVIREMEVGKELFGDRVREWMFDDDTFTIDKQRAVEIAKGMKKLKLTWSCNARAHLDYETLQAAARQRASAAAGGLRIRQSADPEPDEEGSGARYRARVHAQLPQARNPRARHVHDRTADRDAGDDRGDHPLRRGDRSVLDSGFDRRALSRHRALQTGDRERLDRQQRPAAFRQRAFRFRRCATSHLSPDEIEDAVERMYRRFYFRHRPILRFLREMATDRQMLVRRLREGGEFFGYLRERKQIVRSRHEQVQLQA